MKYRLALVKKRDLTPHHGAGNPTQLDSVAGMPTSQAPLIIGNQLRYQLHTPRILDASKICAAVSEVRSGSTGYSPLSQ